MRLADKEAGGGRVGESDKGCILGSNPHQPPTHTPSLPPPSLVWSGLLFLTPYHLTTKSFPTLLLLSVQFLEFFK